MKKYFAENYLYFIIWAVLTALLCVVVMPLCTADYINYDSAYQFFLTRHSLHDIFELLPQDYSPPLYTVLLWLYTKLFGETLFVMRTFAILPLSGMFYLALFPVRRLLGNKTALVMAAFCSLSALNYFFIAEIRPTVLAYFFVTAVAVYAYSAYIDAQKHNFILLSIFAVLSMYTHNIAMLSALGVYATGCAFTLFSKDYAKLRWFLLSGIAAAVCYIPWLAVVFGQFANVRENYWSNSDQSLFFIYNNILGDALNDFNTDICRNIIQLLFAAFISIFILNQFNIKKLLDKKNNQNKTVEILKKNTVLTKNNAVKYGFLVCEFLMSIGIFEFFALCVYPLIAIRYFHIFCGFAMLLVSVLIAKSGQKIMPVILLCVMIVNSAVGFANKKKAEKDNNMLEMVQAIKDEHPDGNIAFLHAHEWTVGIMMYYFPNAKHYVYDKTWCVLTSYDVFPSEVVDVGAAENIADYCDDFYVFGNSFPDHEGSIADDLLPCGKFEIVNSRNYQEDYSYQQVWCIEEVKTLY